MNLMKRLKLSSVQIILGGFVTLILFGTCLLCLPFSSVSRQFTPFTEALFTATSATCVTGLIVHDTATYWSLFGKLVILTLIQIGGMGVVTIAVAIGLMSGKKISLFERSVMQDSISADQVGGILRLTKFILKGSACVEGIGAVLLFPVFIRNNPPIRAIGLSVFHSVSAFCNAGFDLMGSIEQYSSLTHYGTNVPLNVIIMTLIVVGGIGFATWDDIQKNKWKLHRYRLQSKLILVTSLILIVIPAVYFFCFEFTGMPLGQRTLYSLFQSVTARTAGFNTADQAALSETGIIMMIFLMLIGGSPGSTAGGMKTTTIAILFLSCISVFHRHDDATVFGRRIPPEIVRNATAIFMLYMQLFVVTGCIISRIEGIDLLPCLYETASAVGTVGLTTGITPDLCTASRILLIFLMILGRVGGLTMIYALPQAHTVSRKLPKEHVNVG